MTLFSLLCISDYYNPAYDLSNIQIILLKDWFKILKLRRVFNLLLENIYKNKYYIKHSLCNLNWHYNIPLKIKKQFDIIIEYINPIDVQGKYNI